MLSSWLKILEAWILDVLRMINSRKMILAGQVAWICQKCRRDYLETYA
jgi:hypothetical protein